MKVGGVELPAADYHDLAQNVLSGRLGELRRDDPYPVEWFFRAVDEAGPHLDALTRGLSQCLDDADPLVRRQAMLFFQHHPNAAGAERVEALAQGDRSGLAQIADPMHPNDNLELALLDALAARVRNGHGVAPAKKIALEPGKALPLAAALMRKQPDWTVAHAEAIVRGTPSAAIAILVQLERMGRDYAELEKTLAPLAGPGFAEDAERFLKKLS